MTALRTTSALALALLALAACSKGPAKSGQTAAASGGAPAAAPAAPAAGDSDQATGPEIPASEMPAVKAGLWEITETSPGRKPRVEQHCESGKRHSFGGKGCAKMSLHRTLTGGYVIDGQCGGNGMTAEMHMFAHGDLGSHYVVESTLRMKMPNQPDTVESSRREGVYKGACPAGMDTEDSGEDSSSD